MFAQHTTIGFEIQQNQVKLPSSSLKAKRAKEMLFQNHWIRSEQSRSNSKSVPERKPIRMCMCIKAVHKLDACTQGKSRNDAKTQTSGG